MFVRPFERDLPAHPAVRPLVSAPIASGNRYIRPAGSASTDMTVGADYLNLTALRSSRRLTVRLELVHVANE